MADAHPIADPTDTLLGWASQTELDLAQRLKKVERIVDLELGNDELERLEQLYGIFVRRQLQAGATLEPLLRVSPALTLVTAMARALWVVDPHRFQQEFFSGLGVTSACDLDVLIPELLEHFGLTTETNAGGEAPGTDPAQPAAAETEDSDDTFDASALGLATQWMCAHAGLVNNEVAGLLEYLDDLGPFPRVLAKSAELLPQRTRSLIEAVGALREFALAHPASWFDRDRTQLPALPKPVAESIAAELRERPVGTEHREEVVGVAHRELRPRVLFDVHRNKVCLRLPEQRLPRHEDGTFGEVHWRVSVEGTTKVYRTGAPWHSAQGFAEALDVTIDRPVRELTVQDLTNGISWTVPVVDDEAALIMTTRGANLSDKASLHYQRIIVLAAANASMVDVVTSASLTPDSVTGTNWEGWRAYELDLTSAASLALVKAGERPNMERVRSVDPRRRVAFVAPEPPVPALHSAGGLAVYATSLIAEFPPTLSGEEETWYLSISSFGGAGSKGDEVLAPEELLVPAEGGEFAVFDPELYDAPWVGEYLIRLRGPRNESFRHEYAIVEGASTTVTMHGGSQEVRIPTGGGLSEVSMSLKPGSKPFEVVPREVRVASNASVAELVVSTEEGDQLPLRYSPPRLTFEVPLTTEPPMWRALRVALRPRDLDMGGHIRVRAGGALGDPRITLRNHHGAPLRTIKLETLDHLTYTAAMAGLAGASSLPPSGRLDLEWTESRRDHKVSVAIADLAAAEDHEVRLEDGRLVSTASALWVWPATAPWQPACSLTLQGGSVALPARLVDAGPLVVQPCTLDPCMTLIPPVEPGPLAVRLEQPGHFDGGDPRLGELAAFLAGEREDAPNDPELMPVLWDMVTTGVSVGESAAKVRKVFIAHPSAALNGLSGSLVPAHRQPGLLVESGLVRAKFELSDDVTMHRVPWIGTLELLGSLAQGPTPEVVRQLRELGGENLIAMLRTARDTTLDTACIDKSTVAIAGMDEAQQAALLEMFFSRSKIVPGRLMDDSSRLLAVFETFNQRDALRELFASEGLIQASVTLLRTLRSTNKVLYAMARIRFDKLEGVDTDDRQNHWALAPVVSLVLAFAARMSAHGMMTSNKTLDAATSGWAKMADLVPDLVTGDLIAADALVLALLHQQRDGEQKKM